MKHTFILSFLLGFGAVCLVSCTQTYRAHIGFNDGSDKEVVFKAKNDSLANVQGYMKFIDALNEFERTEGNKSDLRAIDKGKQPSKFAIFREKDGKEVTNLTKEIIDAGKERYEPSQLRLDAEKAEMERIAALEKIAWGALTFGMSQKEVQSFPEYGDLRASAVFSVNYGPRQYSYRVSKRTCKTIASELELLCTPNLVLTFTGGENGENNELIEAELKSDYLESSDFYHVIADCEHLLSLVSNKYGEPTSRAKSVGMDNLKNARGGNDLDVAEWTIGHKKMRLYYWKTDDGRVSFNLTSRNDQYPSRQSQAPDSML